MYSCNKFAGKVILQNLVGTCYVEIVYFSKLQLYSNIKSKSGSQYVSIFQSRLVPGLELALNLVVDLDLVYDLCLFGNPDLNDALDLVDDLDQRYARPAFYIWDQDRDWEESVSQDKTETKSEKALVSKCKTNT